MLKVQYCFNDNKSILSNEMTFTLNDINNYINMYHDNQNNKDDYYRYDAGSIDINNNSYMTSIEKKFREEASKYPKTG